MPTLEATINSVLLDYDADVGKQNLMAGIRDSIPLINAPLIDAWKARLQHYPDALQLAAGYATSGDMRKVNAVRHDWSHPIWNEWRGELRHFSGIVNAIEL